LRADHWIAEPELELVGMRHAGTGFVVAKA